MINMATAKQVNNFIQAIAPLIVKYAAAYGYKVASPIIAQACLESAYGTSQLAARYHNYHGMKCGSSWQGRSVNMATKEEYTAGVLTDIRANFRAYDTAEDGIKGYFEFIKATRYANLKTATTPQQYLEMIKADGYATSSSYVANNMKVIDKYNLTQYDNPAAGATPAAPAEPVGTTTEIKYARVYNCFFLNCREKANGKILGTFKAGATLMIMDKAGAWYRVAGKGTKGETLVGYCASKYLKEV